MITSAIARLAEDLRADLLVSWIGGAGAVRYLVHVARAHRRSPLDARAAALIGALGAMCLLRTLAWLAPTSLTLGVIGYVPTTLLPLAMCVFVEGLLRRHLPRWLKVLGAGTSAAGWLANLLRPVVGETRVWPWLGRGFPILLLVVMTLLAVVLARRDRRSLSRGENALIRAMVWVAALAVPLTATDFRVQLFGFAPIRVGGIGVLLLTYTLLRRQRAREGASRWLADVAALAGRALVATGAIAFVVQPTRATSVEIAAVAMALVLLFAVGERLRDLEPRRRSLELLDWLAAPAPQSLAQFAHALRRLPLTADALLVQGSHLAAYHAPALLAALGADAPVTSLMRLRRTRDGDALAARGVEELIDLLERNAMTHVGCVRAEPLCLLLAAIPDVPGTGDATQELAAVLRRGQHALALERNVARVRSPWP